MNRVSKLVVLASAVSLMAVSTGQATPIVTSTPNTTAYAYSSGSGAMTADELNANYGV